MLPCPVDTALAVNMTLTMSDSRNQETRIENPGLLKCDGPPAWTEEKSSLIHKF